MQLFRKEVINQKRQNQNRELTLKNEKLITSLKKVLALQKDIEFDADKAKKVKDYQIWCEDLQNKQSKELALLKSYEELVETKREELYQIVGRIDQLEDKLLDLEAEIGRKNNQIEWNKAILDKQHAIVPRT